MMQYDRSKLKEVVLYIAEKCPSHNLGATKLHKVLYFSDMIHYMSSGSPLTGATYRKRPHGPTCDDLLIVVRDLEREGSLGVNTEEYFGFQKKTFVAKKQSELNVSESSRALIDEVIDFVCLKNTAKTISDFSHNRAWEIAEFGEELPYSSAMFIFPGDASLESLEWANQEVKSVEASRPEHGTLGGSDIRDFRNRILAAH